MCGGLGERGARSGSAVSSPLGKTRGGSACGARSAEGRGENSPLPPLAVGAGRERAQLWFGAEMFWLRGFSAEEVGGCLLGNEKPLNSKTIAYR
jgi:hypothetical protein